jgi:RNA-directed DNA polymerase
MSREVQVRFCESLWGKFPRATLLVIHAVSESQAHFILNALNARMRDCGLALHPEKTKIVYCQDGKRKMKYHNTKFDFLGYTFNKRSAKGPYGLFLSFLPAVSDKAVRKISEEIRSWRISSITHISMVDLANRINPKVRGWINYYGKFSKSILRNKVINLIVFGLERWVTRKYKSLKRRPKRARQWLAEIAKREPKLFSHWLLWKNNDGTTGAV